MLLPLSNTAIHLSRPRLDVFFIDHTLRPGDGQRYAAEFTAISSVFEIIACGTVSIQLLLET